MPTKELWKFLNNSLYIADLFDVTESVPLPFKVTTRDMVYKRLINLDDDTRLRLDNFIMSRIGNNFIRGDLSDSELFMLRLRYIFGLTFITGLMESEENESLLSFDGSLDQANVFPFVQLWNSMHCVWIELFSRIIKQRKCVPFEYHCYSEVLEVMHLSRKLSREGKFPPLTTND